METSLELRNFTKQNMIVVIAATTIAEIEFFQRSLLLRLLESGFHMITAITELFFSVIAAITAIVAIIWKPGFK